MYFKRPKAIHNSLKLPLRLLVILLFIIMCPQDANANSLTSVRTKKTVYLIRHAESEENRRIAAFSRSFQSLKKFTLPKSSDVLSSTELLNVPAQVDSNVSGIGANQISHMGEKLRKEKFVESNRISLVVHSPLLRARQTSEGMLNCMAGSSSDDEEIKASTVSRVIQTDLLLEKTLSEWTPMYYNGFIKRIRNFEAWLGEQPEETIALVGHSQFFKAMLGVQFKFDNCEVWKVDFEETTTIPGTSDDDASKVNQSAGNEKHSSSCKDTTLSLPSCWSNLEKVHACEIKSSPKTLCELNNTI